MLSYEFNSVVMAYSVHARCLHNIHIVLALGRNFPVDHGTSPGKTKQSEFIPIHPQDEWTIFICSWGTTANNTKLEVNRTVLRRRSSKYHISVTHAHPHTLVGLVTILDFPADLTLQTRHCNQAVLTARSRFRKDKLGKEKAGK